MNTNTTWTREAVENLQLGTVLEMCLDSQNPRYGFRGEVVEIIYRGVSQVDGKAYVGFYTKFGENSRMSGSIKEGELHYRVVQ